jgi:putative SOS response-associated peptidase YedK
MCNLLRYKNRIEKAYAKWEFSQVRIEPKFRHKIPPSEPAPVITVRDGAPQLTMLKFGFATERGRQMMARGETIAQRPMFRDAFKHRRCLILAHGFYDSEDMGKYKQPWHFHLKDDELMCFAGLWEEHAGEENFTIVSAPANSVVSRVLDRMPVILPEDHWVPWLNTKASSEELRAMLQSYASELMEGYPVTRMVNQKGFEGPECIERIVPEQGDLGIL